MAIQFRPKQGMILTCDFDGMLQPEMIKVRKVVIVSPDSYHRTGLHSVVPLSATPPEPVTGYHYKLSEASLDSYSSNKTEVWAKCDMIYTMRRARLDRIKLNNNGTRSYVVGQVTTQDLNAIQLCIRVHLGL